jgi:large subunit ribosomal protein L22
MSKPNHPRMLAETESEAVLRNIRVSPRKLNLVAASIRNLPAGSALSSLTFSKRRIAQQVKKVLESAIANAENNHQLDVDRLVVTTADVGRGVVMRRFQARGRGKAARVEKWFSHLRIVVAERDILTKAERRAAGRKRPGTVAATGAVAQPAETIGAQA